MDNFLGSHDESKKTYYKVYTEKSGDTHVKAQVGTKDKDGGVRYGNFIEGKLIDLKYKNDEYQGNEVVKLELHLKAPSGDVAVFSGGAYTSMMRDIMNCLAGVESFGDKHTIRLTPFISTDENSGKTYIHGSVRYNNEKLQKKYRLDQIPKITMVTVAKKQIADTSERDAFFDKMFEEVRAKLPREESSRFDSLGEMAEIPEVDESVPF